VSWSPGGSFTAFGPLRIPGEIRALCNGSSGTPDLRNRFVIGAGGEHPFNTIGGQSAVTLKTDNLPAHDHGYNKFQQQSDTWKSGGEASPGDGTGGTTDARTESVGTGKPFDILPPWLALSYIMKTAKLLSYSGGKAESA
jgi:microcystin-dependent protein